jgi:2-polyprenyl-6-methoxyphenol hydroxylase-like FAD-dependent oxidoreductase
VQRTRLPFVQVIFDIEVDQMAFGRVCLIGDAAFALRPHAAAGTAKAAADGWALAEALAATRGDLRTALPRWERRQLAIGRAVLQRTRRNGDKSQFEGGWRPGDPALVFGLHDPVPLTVHRSPSMRRGAALRRVDTAFRCLTGRGAGRRRSRPRAGHDRPR